MVLRIVICTIILLAVAGLGYFLLDLGAVEADEFSRASF